MTPANFNKINALVIDNNGSMRQIMVSMLRAMGMDKVIVANNESQLLTQVATEGINLVVCGWNMPKLNALTVLEKLRKNDSTIKIPFVIVSTIIEQAKIKQAVQLGVSEYLVPPFNKKIFENRVSQALKLPIQPTAIDISRAINSKRFGLKDNPHELKVLIVDDIADNISIIKEVIKDDYKVKAVLNAKSAMKICLSDSPPDIILLDIMMPEVDGLTLCKELKKNPLTQSIVVIFLTALTETKDVVKGLSLGAVDYITKPIIPEILLARIAVHSKTIIDQRAIQAQIDHLLQQNEHFNHYNKTLYHKINDLLFTSSQTLASETTSAKPSKTSLLEIKHDVDMSSVLLNQFNILFSLQLSNGQPGAKVRQNISQLILNVMKDLNRTSGQKNIELFETLDDYAELYCDQVLLKVVFSSLFLYTLDSAPRGSKVSINMENNDNFILVTLHNIAQLSRDIISTSLQPSDSIKQYSTDINIQLAFLAMTQLNNSLYYHSSEKHGTTFYMKFAKEVS